MMILLLAFLASNPEGERIWTKPAEEAYDVVTFHVREDQKGIIIPIYNRVGCAITLSHPFSDVWCSNEQAYVFEQWGDRTLVLKNRAETEHPANLFFFVEGEVVEILITQTDMAHGKRRVVIELLGFPLPEAKRSGPSALLSPTARAPFTSTVVVDPPTLDESDLWLKPLRDEAYTAKSKVADVLYGEGQGDEHSWVYLNPDDSTAAIEKAEVIRGKKKRMGKGWILEYPIPAQEIVRDGTRMLLFRRFALDAGEDIYLRILQTGARNATYTKLSKLNW